METRVMEKVSRKPSVLVSCSATRRWRFPATPEDHGRQTARVILAVDADGFTAAAARVIVRQSA